MKPPMPLSLVRPRILLADSPRPTPPGIAERRVEELDAVEAAELVAAAGRGGTLEFTAAELFAPGFAARGGDASWIATSRETPFEWWDALDSDAGTTRSIAQAIQFGSAWEYSDPIWERDAALRGAFAAAHAVAAAAHPKSNLAAFYPLEP